MQIRQMCPISVLGLRHFLAGLQVYANFGPPPSSPEFMAMTALFFYMSLTLLAAWVERIATAH
jgi:hypothetical protein